MNGVTSENNESGKRKYGSIIIILTIVAIAISSIPIVLAHNANTPFCTITNEYSICANQLDYTPESTVHLSGTGFANHQEYLIRVTRPDGSIVTGDGTFAPWPISYDYVTTSQGDFQFDYVLDGILGTYFVEVLNRNNEVVATHTFKDGPISISFEQCANNDNPTPLGTCHWIGSILQQTNSRYFEGMSVPQRMLIDGVKSDGDHTISFSYQYTKG